MVPFADAFNHKIAKVKLTGHYAVEPICYGEGSSSGTSEDAEAAAESSDDGSAEPSEQDAEQSGLATASDETAQHDSAGDLSMLLS